jgi:hypothetical protein
MSDESIVRVILRIPGFILALAFWVGLAIALGENLVGPWEALIGGLVGFVILIRVIDQVGKAPARIRRARQKAYAEKVRTQTDMSK